MSKNSCEAAESHEVAVKPSTEGFANGAAERHLPHPPFPTICVPPPEQA